MSTTKPKMVSALGVVPKKNSSEIRLIHDASRPTGYSVNSLASVDGISYENTDVAVKHLKTGSYMTKLKKISHIFMTQDYHLGHEKACQYFRE